MFEFIVLLIKNRGRSGRFNGKLFRRLVRFGVCGPNSLCTYTPESGRKCTCVHGYKKKNPTDWSYGCQPNFKPCEQGAKEEYIELRYVEFYGYDIAYHPNITLEACKEYCLKNCYCKGFQFKFNMFSYYSCYYKNLLYNGYQSGFGFENSMYIKLPNSLVSSFQQRFIHGSSYSCPRNLVMPISSTKHENGSLKLLLWLGVVFGALEIILILLFLYIDCKDSTSAAQSYFPIASGFKRFMYAEVKKATRNFSKDIGRGGASMVYKGELSYDRTVAIKVLKEVTHQGEAEFQAEINTIGRLNHMNLIETWGYCVEGKHRLVVYEYIENRSLAKSLHSNELDWGKKLEIAIGTAKGLAYSHEECLEWVLHCDVKPRNILLDGAYNPKVVDFGLS